MRPPALEPTDVILRDGSTLRLRAPQAADADELLAFFERLSSIRCSRSRAAASPSTLASASRAGRRRAARRAGRTDEQMRVEVRAAAPVG